MTRTKTFTAPLALIALGACTDATPETASPSPREVPAPVSECPTATGSGTKHTAVEGDETWTAAASPHVVDTALSVGAGVTVTLEPCTVVQLGPSGRILVEGKMIGLGEPTKGITVQRRDASKPWQKIEVRGGELQLRSAIVEGGGDAAGGPPLAEAMIDVRGDQEKPTQPLFLADGVVVRSSASVGIRLREGGGFAAGSKELSVRDSASFPISVWGRALGTVPANGSFEGNAIDEIEIPSQGGRDDVQEDTTIAMQPVPYRVSGKYLGVRGHGSAALLTIERGVTLRFEKEARLVVEAPTSDDAASGALVADGVTFTSAAESPAPGDWVGIVFRGVPDPRNAVSDSTIAYAGASSQASSFGCPSALASDFGNEGAVLILGRAPRSAFVTGTTIDESAGDGIVRGWTGSEIDFLAGNTFTGVARCHQTFPKPTSSVCPSPAPCPR